MLNRQLIDGVDSNCLARKCGAQGFPSCNLVETTGSSDMLKEEVMLDT